MSTFENSSKDKSSSLLPTISKVAVIGAGAAGLPTAKRLHDYGLEVTVFERNSVAGGVWVFQEQKPPRPAFPSVRPSELDQSSQPPKGQELPFTEYYDDETVWLRHAPPSPCYEALMNNIETSLMKFEGHEYPPGTDLFVGHQYFADYLQGFVKDFGLDNIIRYNTRVENVRKIREGNKSLWRVLSRRLFRDEHGRSVGTWSEEVFDAVVVATGHYHAEYIPDISGLSEWAAKWPQDIFHSKEFRSPKGFKDKTVLLVGTGVSSVDIAREISLYAKHTYRSVRSEEGNSLTMRILKDVVKSLDPKNLTQVAEIERFGSVGSTTQIRENQIFLKDGTVLEGIDRIVFCTGYLYILPFLRPFHGDESLSTNGDPETLNGREAVERNLVTDGARFHNLHKHIFYIHDPTLAFVGATINVATFSFFDVQAMAVAAVFAGKAPLPTVSEMQSEYQARIAAKGDGRGFHELGPASEKVYVDEVVEWINQSAGDGIKVKGHDANWQEARQAGIDRVLRDILSRKEFYGLDAEGVEAVIQDQRRRMIELIQSATGKGA